MADPNSSLQNLLNTLGISDTAAIVAVASFIGDVAGVLGPVGTAVGVIQTVIGWLNKTPSQLDQIQSAIQKVNHTVDQILALVGETAEAAQITNRNQKIVDNISAVSTALQNIPAGLNDPTLYPPSTIINECQLALNDFDLSLSDNLWAVAYTLQVWWTDTGLYQGTCYHTLVGGGIAPTTNDVGYGPQPAPPDQNGATVFCYTTALPAYLLALSTFLAAGSCFDSNFTVNQITTLREHGDRLHKLHDKIKSGIKQLKPPNWPTTGLTLTACPSPVEGAPPPSPAGIRLKYSSDRVTAAMIEYGAVEKYSGYSSIGDTFTINVSSAADEFDPAPFSKLQLRLWKRTKDVYNGVGLSAVWQAVNRLRTLAGDAPLPSPTFAWEDGLMTNFTDWSLRQIAGLSRLARSTNGYSLRAFASFIVGTQPFDTPYAPGATSFSFRNLLTEFSD